MGKRLLVREFKTYSTSYDEIKPAQWNKLLKEFNLENQSELLQEVGLGNRIATIVARQLIEKPVQAKRRTRRNNAPLTITGTEGMIVNFPKCCLPIPGDPILGFVTAGRGIVVHHRPART